MDQIGNILMEKSGLEKHKRRIHLKELARLPSTQSLRDDGADDKTLELARERDQIQKTRPEECWCLGLGYLETRTYFNGEVIPKETCPFCDEGREAQRQADEVKCRVGEQQKKVWRKDAQNKWDKAGIPKRFQDFTLDSSPLNRYQSEIIDKLRHPVPPDKELKSNDDPEWDAHIERENAWLGSWFLYGPFGTGKTGLAVAYARHRLRLMEEEQDEDTYMPGYLLFTTIPKLMSELRDTYHRDDVSEGEVIREYSNAALLIMDDMGAEHVRETGWLEDRLYQIIGERHDEMRSTVFTSNLNLEQLASKVGERITWRIVEMCGQDHILAVKGPNLRDFGKEG